MKRSHKAAGIFAALTLGVAAAVLAHPGQAGGGMGMHGKKAGMQQGMHGAGQQSMTPEARSALMEKNRTEMQKRAREKAATRGSDTHTH